MAKKQVPAVATGTEVVEDHHQVEAEDGVEFVDVTGKDDLPPGVTDDDDDLVKKPVVKPAAKPAAKSAVEDDLPEDLKGKTPAQLAKMYKDAQTLIGRQGTELGDLRRAADKYITSHLTRAAAAPAALAKPSEVVKPLDDVDFFTNPKEAITRLITEHPALKNLQGETKTYAEREIIRARQDAERQFHIDHPDSAEVFADEAFREWIVKSPIRQKMLLHANKNYDLAAANELFSTWKELKAARTPVPTAEEKAAAEAAAAAVAKKKTAKPVADAAAARVPTGGNAAPKGDGSAPKIYRRADLIRLQQENPARYELMGEEITQAYIEGRVR